MKVHQLQDLLERFPADLEITGIVEFQGECYVEPLLGFVDRIMIRQADGTLVDPENKWNPSDPIPEGTPEMVAQIALGDTHCQAAIEAGDKVRKQRWAEAEASTIVDDLGILG